VSQDVVESQLSAMFDGELPSAECELLSRRIDRDDELRGRWSRYAMIGAVMRSEPVAPVGSDFAARVSAAVAKDVALRRRPRAAGLWRGALAASLVVAVAGVSLHMLRNFSAGDTAPLVASAVEPSAGSLSEVAVQGSRTSAAQTPLSMVGGSMAGADSREPVSYVTPAASVGASPALQSQLANYIVAHSEYSRPLLRRNLLSALVGNEEAADNAPAGADVADGVDGSDGGR
jgi:negative regulator of sigma E activity